MPGKKHQPEGIVAKLRQVVRPPFAREEVAPGAADEPFVEGLPIRRSSPDVPRSVMEAP